MKSHNPVTANDGSPPPWRPSPHQHKIDPELAAILPFTVDIPFDRVEWARELEAQRTMDLGGPEVLTLAAALDIKDDLIPSPSGRQIPIRVYRPNYGRAGLGAFVFFHGGGWALGSLDSEHTRCRFPAGFDDCFDAVAWVAEHAAELDIMPGRLAIGGASAGGCLAAGVALRARDEEGPALSFQLLIYHQRGPRPGHTWGLSLSWPRTYTYVPNPYFYNQSAIHWSKVVVKVVSNDNAALSALQTGEVNVAQVGADTVAGAGSSLKLELVLTQISWKMRIFARVSCARR